MPSFNSTFSTMRPPLIYEQFSQPSCHYQYIVDGESPVLKLNPRWYAPQPFTSTSRYLVCNANIHPTCIVTVHCPPTGSLRRCASSPSFLGYRNAPLVFAPAKSRGFELTAVAPLGRLSAMQPTIGPCRYGLLVLFDVRRFLCGPGRSDMNRNVYMPIEKTADVGRKRTLPTGLISYSQKNPDSNTPSLPI